MVLAREWMIQTQRLSCMVAKCVERSLCVRECVETPGTPRPMRDGWQDCIHHLHTACSYISPACFQHFIAHPIGYSSTVEVTKKNKKKTKISWPGPGFPLIFLWGFALRARKFMHAHAHADNAPLFTHV